MPKKRDDDNISATRKADSLIGMKFMLVEVLGGTDAGRCIIAADSISAGIGDRVLVCCACPPADAGAR